MTSRRASGSAKKAASNRTPTNSEIAALAREQKLLDTRIKSDQKVLQDMKPRLVAMMKRARTRLVEAGGVRVVLSTPANTEYDEDSIFTSLSPRQRKLAFDTTYNFSKLSDARRRELTKMMVEALTPAERKRCEEYKFNLDRMSVAVQEGKIPVEVLDDHTSVVPKTPYTTVTFK